MKRKLLTFLVFVVAMTLLVSCAGPATTAPPAEEATAPPAEETTAPAVVEQPTTAPPAEKMTLVFWSHDFPPREKLDRQYMDKFMQDNPNVEVEYVLGPGDDIQYLTKLVTAMAGGEGPDCFNLLNWSAGRLFSQNAVKELNPQDMGYASVEEVEKAYVPGTLKGLIRDGKLYALPSEVSQYSLFVNKKAFTDAGLDAEKDSPKTWDDLVTLGKKMNKVEDGKTVFRAFDFTYGMPDDFTSGVTTLAGMAYQLGGEVLSVDGSEATVNTEPWVRSLQFIQDWVYKEKLGDPALTVGSIGFYEGSIAMTFSGSWYISYIKDQNSPVYDTYGVVLTPRWSDAINNSGTFLYAYGQFVNAATSPEKQTMCVKLIKELASHSEDYLRDAGLLQPTLALTESETFKGSPNLAVFLKDMENTPYWPTHAKAFEIHEAISRAIQRAVTEEQPVQEALDQAKLEIDEALKAK